MNRDTGGPAFPHGAILNGSGSKEGMTLRDWFAGQALAGLCSNMTVDRFVAMSVRDMGHLAYLYADAMIEARRK